MENFRKAWMPWKAADRFASEEDYGQWLQRRLKAFGDLRMLLLILATGLLIVGYVLDKRPVMLVCIFPLVLVLVLTLAMGKTEEAYHQINQTQS